MDWIVFKNYFHFKTNLMNLRNKITGAIISKEDWMLLNDSEQLKYTPVYDPVTHGIDDNGDIVAIVGYVER